VLFENRQGRGYKKRLFWGISFVVISGYRYYSPVLGRWLNRDPIGEDGGYNLYVLCSNSPIGNIDPVGFALYAFDGTANVPSEETNVYLTYNKGWDGKFASYRKGIGNAEEYSVFTRIIRQATGWGLTSKKNSMLDDMKSYIKDGKDLDVDIIGFSRGAVTAIAFAEAVEKLKENGVDPFCRLEKIRFLGLYDPVPGPFIEHRPGIPQMVEKTAIAYSIDEKRTEFAPSLYYGKGITANAFRGGHSDIGGGYKDGRGLANITLQWMIDQGRSTGAPFKYPVSSKLPNLVRHQEYDWMWHYADRILPAIPLHPSANKLIFKPISN